MRPSGKHKNKAYIALDIAESTIKKLKGSTSTAVTWADSLITQALLIKLTKWGVSQKKVLAKNKIPKYLLNTSSYVKNK